MASIQKPGIVNRTETVEHNVPFYAVCSTAAGTAAKTVSVDTFFRLVTGAKVCVRFSNTNTASTPTLNVNGTGAYQIRYRNASGTSGYLQEYVAAGRTYDLVFDGSYWQIVGDVDTILSISDSTSSSSSTTAASSAAVKAVADLVSALTSRVSSIESTLSGGGFMPLPTADNVTSLVTEHDTSTDNWYNYYTPSGGTWFWWAVHQNESASWQAGDEGGNPGSYSYSYGSVHMYWGIDSGGTKVLYYRAVGDSVEQPTTSVCWRIS